MSETSPERATPTPEPAADAGETRVVMDADQISRACARMAHQILEANRAQARVI